jgi:hypothetical protein
MHTTFGKFSYKEEDEEAFLAGLKPLDEVIYTAEDFLFKVDKEANLVNFKKQ